MQSNQANYIHLNAGLRPKPSCIPSVNTEPHGGQIKNSKGMRSGLTFENLRILLLPIFPNFFKSTNRPELFGLTTKKAPASFPNQPSIYRKQIFPPSGFCGLELSADSCPQQPVAIFVQNKSENSSVCKALFS